MVQTTDHGRKPKANERDFLSRWLQPNLVAALLMKGSKMIF
jgi:hypothetical protein